MSVQQYTSNSFGGLQPLVSDLLTQNAAPNSYTRSTYTGDSDAISARLGQYSAYDPSQFGGLRQYLQSKAAAMNNGAMYYKPEDLQNILGGLGSLTDENYNTLKPLMGDLQSIGMMDGRQYYDKTALTNQINPSNYVLTAEGQSLNPAFSDLKKLTTIGGYDYYGDADPNQVARQLDPTRYNKISGSLGAVEAPSGSYYDPRGVQAGKAYYGDPWGFSHEVQQVKDTPYYFAPQFEHTRSGTADTWYGLNDPSNQVSTGYVNGQYGYIFDPTKTDFSSLLTPRRINDRYAEKGGGGLLGSAFSFLDPILDKVDPMHDKAQNAVVKLGGFNSQEQAFSTIMPMIVDYFLPGVGSGLSAANAASTGNWGGALTSALGSYLGYTGQGLNLTDSKLLNQAMTRAAVSGVGTAASGGSGSDVLRNMTLSGLSAYGGGLLGNYTSGLGALGKIAANTAYGAGSNALQAALTNRDVSKMTQAGATNAFLNSALRQARGVDFSKYWS